MSVERFAHFSNSVLEGPLKFIERYQDSERYQAFMSELGVSEDWIHDPKNWHDSKFHQRFYEGLAKYFSEFPDIAFQGTRALYTERKLQQFTSLAGLLLKPERLFGLLPKAAARMNTYNTYTFKMGFRRLAYSNGILKQHYMEPSRVALNGALCDACRGSITGVMSYMGYKLLDVHESRCVRRGDASCEYDITWLNRPLLTQVGAWIAMTSVLIGLSWFIPGGEHAVRALSSALFASLVMAGFSIYRQRASLLGAFEYQDAMLKELRQAAEARELMNRRLIQFQKELNDAISLASIGEASFSMVHDMASPTTLIRMYSDQLSKTIKGKYPEDSEFLHYCNAIDRATQSLVKLQILFRNRASQQESSVVVQRDLRQIVSDLLELFDPLLKKQSVTAQVKGDVKPILVECYEGSIESILLNLFQNSINALSKQSHGTLTVSIEDGETHAHLRIADSGPGIPHERLDRLWERFGASEGRKDQVPRILRGTGFGMYSIKKLVDRMGGEISVESSSSGTTFNILVPKKLLEKAVTHQKL